MKTFWTVLSVLAVANLIALGGFVGWLAKSDRLNMERVKAVREALVKPVELEKQEQAEKAKAAEADKLRAEAEAKASKPPLTAAEKLQARIEATELDRQRLERLKREVADLQQQLAAERARLEADKSEFAALQKQFDQTVANAAEVGTEEQFQKTLKVLVSQKPGQAVILLKQILIEPASTPDLSMAPIANGATFAPPPAEPAPPSEARMGTVVAYLDAMTDKQRSKIMDALTKTDPKLAADLLERLRTRGEFARVP